MRERRSMEKFNSYWPVYKNLEDETLEVAKYIQFDDDQLDVYSMKIADLLVRCAVEIESLSKELYWSNGGQKQYDLNGNERKLYFDTDCIKLLNDLWGLCGKQIFVTSSSFYFCKEENRILMPLKNSNKRGGAKWNKAYQAVKHDRKNCLKQGNIKNLLSALGALYILNIYYTSSNYKLGATYVPEQDFNSRLGSSIFSVYFADATKNVQMCGVETDDALDECVRSVLPQSIYVLKYTTESWKRINDSIKLDNNKMVEKLKNSQELLQYATDNPDEFKEEKNIISLMVKVFGKNYISDNNLFIDFNIALRNAQVEAIIYKNQAIYG